MKPETKAALARGVLVASLVAAPAIGFASDEHDHSEKHESHDAHADDAGADAHEEATRTFSVSDFERSGVRLATAGPGEVDVGVDLPGEVRPNADRIAPSAAMSRSAWRVTMAGFFPPISVIIGRGQSLVKPRYSFIPTS